MIGDLGIFDVRSVKVLPIQGTATNKYQTLIIDTGAGEFELTLYPDHGRESLLPFLPQHQEQEQTEGRTEP